MISPLQWVCVNDTGGPFMQDHAGAIIGDKFYVHGGQSSGRTSSKSASNGLYAVPIGPTGVGSWIDLTTVDSPCLSQHACIRFSDRYLVFIGGWTGQTRIPGVHTYDVVSQKWLPPAVAPPLLKGFPTGAGLSAHTATAMRATRSGHDMQALIIGREGSLRTQRKAGNIYLLRGDFSQLDSGATGAAPRFTYCEANDALTTSSRSYHTSTAVGSNTLVTIGGRNDRPVEMLSWVPAQKSTPDWPGSLEFPQSRCALVSELLHAVRTNSVPCTRMPPAQSGWRGHASIPGNGGLFVSSGEGFNALVRDPLDSAYVFLHHEGSKQPFLLNVGKLQNPRAYAVADVYAADGTAWLHGGIGPGGRTQNTLLRLERSSQIPQDSHVSS